MLEIPSCKCQKYTFHLVVVRVHVPCSVREIAVHVYLGTQLLLELAGEVIRDKQHLLM